MPSVFADQIIASRIQNEGDNRQHAFYLIAAMLNVKRLGLVAISATLSALMACTPSAQDKPAANAGGPTTAPAQTSAESAPKESASTPNVVAQNPTKKPAPNSVGDEARPAPEEWANAPLGEVERAGELGCQVSVVREWVRVACSPKTAKGTRIIDISVFLECQNGSCTSHPERAYMKGGQRILEVPLPEGREIKATFIWENGVEDLRLQWAKDQPRPTKLGAFTTNPDVDSTRLRPQLRAVDCCIEVQGEGTCLGRAAGYADGPCFKAFQKDCKKLVACQMGELPPPCASSPSGCDE